MAKPCGPVCNLNCTYCYYLEKKKLYPGSTPMRMDESLLESFTRQYIESQDVPEVTFSWQGGEPSLAGIGFFLKAVAYQQKYRNGKRIYNAFQTNGTLINEDWCRFFHDYGFLAGISVDGPAGIHDRNRTFVSGKPSFRQVSGTIDLFLKYKVEFNTLTVVHRDNEMFPLEVYRFLKSTGSRFFQFIPVVERISSARHENDLHLIGPDYPKPSQVTDWSVRPEAFGRFLTGIFDEWVRNDVGKVFVQLFDVTLANWIGQSPGLCVFSETCGNALVLEFNGDVYPCDHFVYPEYRLGNIHSSDLRTMAFSDRQLTFGNNKLTGLPDSCMQCEYRFACHGACPKHRFELAPSGEPGLNYLCNAYKMFFSYVHPYMQFMGDELQAKRPPANVMRWARGYKTHAEILKSHRE